MRSSKNNEYTICFKNIIFFMKIFAVFPFYPLHEVFNISHVLSTILTFTSLSMYAWIIFHELQNLRVHFDILIQDYNYIRLMSLISWIISKLSLIISPCTTWGKTKRLQKHRENWIHFQVEMEKLTKTPFRCPLKNRIQGVFASGMISMSSIAILLGTRKWNVSEAASNMIAVLFLTNGTANAMMYWIVNNMFAMSSAKEIIKVAQQTIRKGSYVDVRRLIVIWTTLCDLNDEFIRCHSIRILILFCIIIITEVIGTHSTVVLLVYLPDKSMGLTYLCATMFCILCLIMFCESANSVTENMVYKLKKVLLEENLNNMDNQLSRVILGTTVNFLVIVNQFSPM